MSVGAAAKRTLDVVVSGSALVILSPILVSAALAVRATMGRPVVFRQKRPGLGGAPFTLYKLRTMTDARDASGQLRPDVERLTRLGRFLRRSTIDEVPELWNVIRGDMSLVGPRPLLMEYLKWYTPDEARRHEVRPGLTSLAVVKGRNELAWERRLALDVRYVEERSLWLDIKVLLATVWLVVRRKGVSAPGHATMPRFDRQRGGGP